MYENLEAKNNDIGKPHSKSNKILRLHSQKRLGYTAITRLCSMSFLNETLPYKTLINKTLPNQ